MLNWSKRSFDGLLWLKKLEKMLGMASFMHYSSGRRFGCEQKSCRVADFVVHDSVGVKERMSSVC